MESIKYQSLNLNLNRKTFDTRKIIRLSIMLILSITVLILFILLFIPNSPVNRVTLQFMEWIKRIPKGWGCILLTIIYAISLVFCFPGTPINLAAGFLFGPYLGSVATVLGCDIGAILAFFIGRNLTKDWTTSKMSENEKYSQINTAVSKNGLLIIFLLRLSPAIPFGICNYIFGATNVSFFNYWVGTTFGLLPFTILYTYLGSSVSDLSEVFNENLSDEEKSTKRFYGIVGILFSIVLIIAITLITKRALNNAMNEKKSINKNDIDLEQNNHMELHTLINSNDNILNNSNDSNIKSSSDLILNNDNNLNNNNNSSLTTIQVKSNNLNSLNSLNINNNNNNNNINTASNIASTATINSNNSNKIKTIFKRSPTDNDISIDSNSTTTEEYDNNFDDSHINHHHNKDIILTINDNVEFENDDDDDFNNNSNNDKTFLVKNNYQNSIQKQIK